MTKSCADNKKSNENNISLLYEHTAEHTNRFIGIVR